MLASSMIKISNYRSNFYKIHLGLKVLAGPFRSIHEVIFLLMTFCPTLGVKGPNG